MNVLIATEKPFSAAAVEKIEQVLKAAGHTPVLLERYTPASLAAAVVEADAMIVRSDIVDAALIAKAPRLKIVVRAGAGYDNIDLAAATAASVVVENTPGQNANAVAELVIGLAVLAARNGFNGSTGFELGGKRLGLHAFGQVSRHVVPKAQGLGMDVAAFDPFCPDSAMLDLNVRPVADIETLYENSDIVSLHIPATPQTKGSIGRALLSKLPKGAVLVNTARKEVINEPELLELLAERPDLKYVADVKPDNADKFIEQFGTRVFFTPKKTGAQTAEANMNAGVAAARQIADFFATGEARFKVN